MSAKNRDNKNRWRNITVGFRVSPEENELINKAVALSGLPKQEYCYRRCLNQDVVVQGNPRVYKALKLELAAVLTELKRIEAGNSVDEELLNVIELIAIILGGLKGEDVQGDLRAGCSIIPKGEVYESHIFTKKEEWFKNKSFTKEVKELFTDTINRYVKEESEKLSVFQQGGVYLATKKIGKNNPKAEEIKADKAARQEWNRTVDVALVEGVPEEDILKIKQEKITDETLQSIRTHGWLPDMFRQIIRGAKDFLQEVIFKFKLPPRPMPKIDLQEWKDMQKLMYELQRQSREIKRTQQDISSLKKQLSELRGFFKGKERKSLEGKIEALEDLEKRLHRSMEQIVKREGYPNVQAFQKVYNKAEALIMEYNEELRAWKNQTGQKKENTLEQPKKASVLEKLHRYQQEGRQQPKRSVKKKSMDRER